MPYAIKQRRSQPTRLPTRRRNGHERDRPPGWSRAGIECHPSMGGSPPTKKHDEQNRPLFYRCKRRRLRRIGCHISHALHHVSSHGLPRCSANAPIQCALRSYLHSYLTRRPSTLSIPISNANHDRQPRRRIDAYRNAILPTHTEWATIAVGSPLGYPYEPRCGVQH